MPTDLSSVPKVLTPNYKHGFHTQLQAVFTLSYKHPWNLKGVVILFAKNTWFQIKDTKSDPSDQFLIIKGHLDGHLITLANSDQLTYIQKVLQKWDLFRKGDLITRGGDFNHILNSQMHSTHFQNKKTPPKLMLFSSIHWETTI